MPNQDYSEIYPVDVKNPFRNPTEEPDYTPDYHEILPEIDMPECRLPLFPLGRERRSIHKFYALTFLAVLFGYLTALSVFTLIQLIATVVLQQIDMRALGGTLPQNYNAILQQFMSDSSIMYAANLIAFLFGNLFGFLVGCKLTNLKPQDFFQLRKFTMIRCLLYVFAGLLIQQGMGMIANLVYIFCEKHDITLASPDFSLSGSWKRTAVIVIYVVLIAPVTEELLMRGLVLRNLSRVSQRFGIFLSAFLFALMHENVAQFIYTLPLGILLGYITIRHHSVTPAIIVHMVTNAAGIVSELLRLHLSADVFNSFSIIFMLSVLLFGGASLIWLAISEHLPDQTPHQRSRSLRIAAASPLLWVLVSIHLVFTWLAAK
ncbi:MAG: CPBP family intramembrane metalloprotease [Oscillospiraceae bacterium]|nr:CPBP family intramembrane metalloprotease [Oscillospiraceae bacterium]